VTKTRSSVPPRGEVARSPARWLGYEDVAIFETFVVPRYLTLFGERLVRMLAAGRDARVCHVHCRTGYPDHPLLERLPNAHVHGCDVSEHAIALARAKAAALPKGSSGVEFDYRVIDGLPLSFPEGAFSHAFTVHPLAAPSERKRLVTELARIVAPHGQALLAMPLRGSFVEIADLLRECAIKHELVDLTNAVEAAVQLRPTDEMLSRELEEVGFEYIDVDVHTRKLKFEGGRGFFEDPITRLLLLPEFRVNLALDRGSERLSSRPAPPSDRPPIDPWIYVRDAIDKYWSDASFELTVNVGVVSGRRK
jgi:SAM-dependent methyltransferase